MPTNSQTCLFLCGDVMTGRGIDQILPHPVDPAIHESYVPSALDYVALAEETSGLIPRKVDWDYIWGEALTEWRRLRPDARIINLETAVTTCEDWMPKGINYRMHPDNAPCIKAAEIDCCVLANNHVLDWGVEGLLETLSTLEGITSVCGAGANAEQARAPARIAVPGRKVHVIAAAVASSGVPPSWAATAERPGVFFLPDLDDRGFHLVKELLNKHRQDEDLAVFSIHWGGNWGYEIPEEHRRFATRLIDDAGVDLVYGHSSHHPKGIEVYRGKPILYGCGDFLNDYEGIRGYERFRDDLTLMYFPVFGSDRRLRRFLLTPLQIHRFSLRRPADTDRGWLCHRIGEECKKLGTRLRESREGRFELDWEDV